MALTRRAFLATLAGSAIAVAGRGGPREGPALAFGPVVDGVVVDFADQAPVANAEVGAAIDRVAMTPGSFVRTDGQGRFRLGLPDGATGLVVHHPDYLTAIRPFLETRSQLMISVQRASFDRATERAIFLPPRQLSATAVDPSSQAVRLMATGSANLGQLSCQVTLKRDDGSTTQLELNEYLRGVVPSEMPASWGSSTAGGFEALKAQAVAARTYAVRVQAIRGYVIAGPADQVWQPVYYDASDRALAATGYEILAANDEAILAYYASTCGGHTTDGSFSYLLGRRDDSSAARLNLTTDELASGFWGSDAYGAYCKSAGSSLYRWKATWDRAALEAILDAYLPLVPDVYRSAPYTSGDLGTLTALKALSRSVSGKILTLRVGGNNGDVERFWDINHEYWIRSLLRSSVTGELQYSANLALTIARGGDGSISSITAAGGGWGHGLGMCQWGAYGMAKAGRDYRAILGQYYSGTSLVPLAGCGSTTVASPPESALYRPGEPVTYSWTLVPGADRYRIEIRNSYVALVSVSGWTTAASTTLPAPGPAGQYTWQLVATIGGTDRALLARKLVTADRISRYYVPVVIKG